MITIQGKYCKDVKIFTDNVENEALQTIYNIANNITFSDSKIRIMPDCHNGVGIVIGFTSPLTTYVNPSHVGCDIGCSMTTMLFDNKLNTEDYKEVEHKIRQGIPTGFDIQKYSVINDKDFIKFMNSEMRKARSLWPEMVYPVEVSEKYIYALLKRINMDPATFFKSICTLGGGNHFIEYGEYENGSAWTIHCGSRNFGMKIFKYWEKIANRPYDKRFVNEKIKEIKKTIEDKTKLPEIIKQVKEEAELNNLQGYLYGEDMKGYITDIFFAQAYAKYNHKLIAEKIYDIVRKFGLNKISETIYTTHNYISHKDHIIRKGSISSYEGEKMIIPFNMRDGIAICEGKSNEDWNYSAPHGAGRIMSRSKAKQNVSLEEFTKSMEGIYSTCVGVGTLDESPMVYKDMNEILELIKPTVDILFLIKPKINIKAYESVD